MTSLSLPVPTIVHTLVSPISTCQSEPDDAPPSLDEPRLLDETEPAELGLRRPLPTPFEIALALDADRFFFTRPPSLERNSDTDGEVGALPVPYPKYSLLVDPFEIIGEPGRTGELDPVPW